MRVVVKVGGSLMMWAYPLLNAMKEAEVKALIVPGGGIFADVVR